MLLPLHDPIRLAEDSATLSLLSGGRFDLGVGMGYRQVEFDAFGRSIANRPSLLEEGVEVIRRAWSGEPIDFAGRASATATSSCSRCPSTCPKLLVGGMADAAIERAARIADGFLSTQNAHQATYLDAVRQHHGDLGEAAIYAGQWVIIAEDPEREWARIGDHALVPAQRVHRLGRLRPAGPGPAVPRRDAIVAAGAFQLWDPDTAVAELTALLRGHAADPRRALLGAAARRARRQRQRPASSCSPRRCVPAVRQALADGAAAPDASTDPDHEEKTP